MGILNEGYVFERDAPLDARFGFRYPPKKKLFQPGVEFCRFITVENPRTDDKGNQVFGSPWWVTKETFTDIVKLSNPKRLGIADVARIRLAVSTQFNPKMEWISVIYLTHPVYGWFGVTRRHLASKSASIFFAGGEAQVFLPNLATLSGMASEYARMRFFGVCPDHF